MASLMAMIFYSAGHRAKSAQGKGVWGEESQVLKCPVLVEPHRTSLIPPVRSCKNIYKVLPIREANWKFSV